MNDCYVHGPEPVPDNAYLVCGECGHAYATRADLVAAERETVKQMQEWSPGVVPITDPERIYACPFCLHDF